MTPVYRMVQSLDLYHRLPPQARSLVASVRGLQLRWRRYGADTERLVADAIEREHWKPEQWKTWRENRMGIVLHRAATQVPYYRDLWLRKRRGGDRSSWEYLENWPVLDKESVRPNPKAFLADDRNRGRMMHVHTSGTTGKPLDLWRSREVDREWYALFEARWRRWYGVSRFDRWAIIGGQLVTPASQLNPPFWVWNAGLRQLYMSAYHLSPGLIGHYLQALGRYRITYLWGYTSALYELAKEVLRLEKRDLDIKVVIANAEPVSPHQRQVVEEAFQSPLRETYGMAEMVAAAGECQAREMHLWPEAGYCETFNGDEPTATGAFGDLIATGLVNSEMPLIRYRVGDRVALGSADGRTCECGRSLPLLAAVEGRNDDVLYTRDGRRIGRLDPVFKTHLPLREAQIIQQTLDQITVRYVPTAGFDTSACRSISEQLRARMGDIKVVLEAVDRVPRGANGKFRAVVCELPREQLDALRQSSD
jgi:phenylacetate-coenzyme A ligase PaaK-like adenylate-forming protein